MLADSVDNPNARRVSATKPVSSWPGPAPAGPSIHVRVKAGLLRSGVSHPGAPSWVSDLEIPQTVRRPDQEQVSSDDTHE